MKAMKTLVMWLVCCLTAAGSASALAQAASDMPDVGLVNFLNGKVSFDTAGRSGQPARPFMMVRQGDRFTIPSGATLRLIYFRSGRQENWQGPASLRAGVDAGEMLSGKAPVVSNLPASVPQKVAGVPELLQVARLGRTGGVTVRDLKARPAGPVPAEVQQARAVYKTMRAQASQEDVTPELFLLAVLEDNRYVHEMGPVVQEMLNRQPDTPEVRELAQWVQMRIKAAQ